MNGKKHWIDYSPPNRPPLLVAPELPVVGVEASIVWGRWTPPLSAFDELAAF